VNTGEVCVMRMFFSRIKLEYLFVKFAIMFPSSFMSFAKMDMDRSHLPRQEATHTEFFDLTQWFVISFSFSRLMFWNLR